MATNSQVLRNKATNMMTGFSAGQRMVVGIAILTMVIGGVMFTQWASRPTMVPLYSNLSSEDASAITGKLQSNKVQYQLTDGGATIMVPQSKVYQTRLDMAGEGLPNGGSSGYTLLDKNNITTSDFMQHVDYQRALEGEIGKTIGSIDGVQAASVHLVIPQTDVFSGDSEKPSASVLVKVGTGKALSNSQVQSIVHLVASAVQGLDPNDVTVADDTGRMLAAPGQGVTGGSDQQTDTTNALETDLNNKIQSILTPLVGPGKSVVQARTQLNWDKIKQTSEVYNPNNKPANASSSSTSTETYGNGTGAGTTGCLGANITVQSAACTDSSTTTGGTSGTGAYQKSQVTQDNVTDRTVTETETTPGAINRVSVAVLLDSNVPNIDTQEVTDLVTQAAGLEVSRGDTVTVKRMPFDTAASTSAAKELAEADKAKKTDQMMGLIKTIATVVIIGIVLAVLFITTKKKARSYTSTPISLAELDAAMPALPSADEMLAEIERVEEDTSPEALERAKVDKEITSLIEKQPDEVAQLLRSWLADRRG